MSLKAISIAIDGPAGSGKSTISKALALRFGLSYVDTGAMYRGVALQCKKEGAPWEDEAAASKVAEEAEFRFEAAEKVGRLINRVFVNGAEVTEAIRSEDISQGASKVSAISGVRRALVAQQKRMGAAGGVVMEGRDIGSVVMPGAEVKIFLTASPEERARRRHREILQKGGNADFGELLQEMRMRDERDSNREDSPLLQTADAVLVDTDGKGIEQVVEEIAKIANQAIGRQSS